MNLAQRQELSILGAVKNSERLAAVNARRGKRSGGADSGVGFGGGHGRIFLLSATDGGIFQGGGDNLSDQVFVRENDCVVPARLREVSVLIL